MPWHLSGILKTEKSAVTFRNRGGTFMVRFVICIHMTRYGPVPQMACCDRGLPNQANPLTGEEARGFPVTSSACDIHAKPPPSGPGCPAAGPGPHQPPGLVNRVWLNALLLLSWNSWLLFCFVVSLFVLKALHIFLLPWAPQSCTWHCEVKGSALSQGCFFSGTK